jgi:hypothetical protein
MKKVGLIVGVGIVVVIIIAAVMAGQMGETSHAFARGKIVLDESLIGDAGRASTLYIIISGNDRPMPYGAYRRTIKPPTSTDVFEFALTRDNIQAMMDMTTWPPEVKLKARLDMDGVAGPDQPGDLVGELYPVALGSKDLVLKIDRKIQ